MGSEMVFVFGMAAFVLLLILVGVVVAIKAMLSQRMTEAEKEEYRRRSPRVFWFFRL